MSGRGQPGYALVFLFVLGGRLPVTDAAEGKGSALTSGLWGTPGRKTSVRQVKATFAGCAAAVPQQNITGGFKLFFCFHVFKCLGPGDPGQPLRGQPGWV